MSDQEREFDQNSLDDLLEENGGLTEDELSDRESAAMEEAYNRAKGIKTEMPELKAPAVQATDDDPEPPHEQKTVDDKIAKDKVAIDDYASQIRSLQAKFGTLNSKLAHIQSSVNGRPAQQQQARPSDERIIEAFKDKQAFDNLKEDYPELAESLEIQKRIIDRELDQRLEGAKPDLSGYVSKTEMENLLSETANKARQEAILDTKYPEWENIVVTQEFQQWLSSQDDKTQDLASSSLAKDAITVFDAYHAHKDVSSKQQKSQQQRQRLAAAAPATTRSTPVKQVQKTEDDFLAEGYSNIRGR